MASEHLPQIPSKLFLTRGSGRHRFRAQSLELAYRNAGIQKFNLVKVSGIVPARCKFINAREGISHLSPGQVVYGVISEVASNEPNRLIGAGVAVAKAIKDQYGYISHYEGYGLTEERLRDEVDDAAVTMLATTLGIEFDPAKNYDERKEIYRMSGYTVRARNTVQTAEGDKNGLWTTVIAAAIFII
jgi:arginine decarboxylase